MEEEVAAPAPVAAPVVTAASAAPRAPWTCPRCTLHNDYWRIICRVCSAIKPYFDDFTTDRGGSGAVVPAAAAAAPAPLVTANELGMFGRQILARLPTNANNETKNQIFSFNEHKSNNGRKIEKIILGDEISVADNARANEPKDFSERLATREMESNNGRRIEKIMLGEEITRPSLNIGLNGLQHRGAFDPKNSPKNQVCMKFCLFICFIIEICT